MRRCQPLLGTFVEISIADQNAHHAIQSAFEQIKKVEQLMSFHNADSELSIINAQVHCKSIRVHPWTAQILRIAQDLNVHSGGLFNCGIGHRLITAGLLPKHIDFANHGIGGIEDLYFIDHDRICSLRPLCLDLGGIAKGFAVDEAVKALIKEGVSSGIVNAGGDLRVFGNEPQTIYLRNPQLPQHLIELGALSNGAIATSALYFAKRDQQHSHIINPLSKIDFDIHEQFSGSYSVLAKECVYADALTKVLALSRQGHHPCFARYSAQAIQIAL
ncbi:FAD:protein FMN transferase [Polynucleobacter sp. 15G-AUS-farblos]|uniref:FAD:protein FMN transferase n=1 Tax=Polynucleobacter sp. 15G-AUS-farblos TaxID=2689094 RepID=UPI00210275AD|nr:FAD:protein FMN transferase [Polynucleobacter sp. 15G-AUS-farblos]MBU3584163.1 FAD:protein FMN transferase [Polynucleobacter sp. 15G-AUS-farblos]